MLDTDMEKHEEFKSPAKSPVKQRSNSITHEKFAGKSKIIPSTVRSPFNLTSNLDCEVEHQLFKRMGRKKG